MDRNRFDALTRALASPRTRRRLLSALATLPVVGGLAGALSPEETAAKDRRRRRKQRHKRRQTRRSGKGQQACKAQGKGKVCAGRCGSVTGRETCGKTVDCGSCDCPTPCGPCRTCQSGPNSPGACIVDPEQIGEPCGGDGQVCQDDGACACAAGSCANPAPICANGTCVACSATQPCPAGCCDATGACRPGDTTTACGGVRQVCRPCLETGEVCTGGRCVCSSGVFCPASGCCPNDDDVCDAYDQCCGPTTCTIQGKNCGTISDGCGGFIDCGPCIVAGEVCGAGGANLCGDPQGTCAADANVCTGTGDFSDCNGGGRDCVCMTTTASTTACVNIDDDVLCVSCSPSNPSCPVGTVCVSVAGSNCALGCEAGQYACVPPCPAP